LGAGLLALSLAVTSSLRAEPEAPVLHLEGGPNTPVTCLAFSPDGRRLYAGGYDKVVHVWDWDEDQRLFVPSPLVYRIPIYPGASGVINALAISPDGRWLAIGGQGIARRERSYEQKGRYTPVHEFTREELQDRGLIYVLDLNPKTGEEKGRFVLRKQEAPTRSLAFAPASPGKKPLLVSVATEPEDTTLPARGRVCLWDVEAASDNFRRDREAVPLAEYTFTGMDHSCPGIAIHEDGAGGAQVALAWSDRQLRVWDALPRTEPPAEPAAVPDGPAPINNTVAHVPGMGWLTGPGGD
jgi:WD40 repeat protein